MLFRSASITPKALSIGAPSLASKDYDSFTTAGTCTPGSLSGTVGGETLGVSCVGAAYSSANVGSYTSTITYTLTNGTSGTIGVASDYSLASGSATGAVTAKALSIGAPSLASKVYDGTTTAGTCTPGTLSGLVGSQTLGVSCAGSAYSSANVGSSYASTITYTLVNGGNGGLATNYSLVNGSVSNGTITARSITITATNADKVADSSTSSSAIPTLTSGSLAPGQTGTYSQSYASSAIADSIVITPAVVSIKDSGNVDQKANYSIILVNGSGNITAAAPVVVSGPAPAAPTPPVATDPNPVTNVATPVAPTKIGRAHV